MSRRFLKCMMGAWGLLAVSCGPSMAGDGMLPKSSFIAVGGQTLVPYGWVDFCNRYASECSGRALAPMDLNLTPKTAKILEKTNAWVNSHVKAMSDQDHWGVVDQWDYPSDGYGDCEDYALFKRRLLMEEGFPRQSLLMTVVKDENGEGHAVLTVKTSQGEYVLDNLHDQIKPWSMTGYRFVKRQSQTDQNVWVDIGEPTQAPLMVSR